MDPSNSPEFSETPLGKPKNSFWRKLGGGSLSVSLVVHAVILGLGLVWIIQVIPPPPEKIVDVDFESVGGVDGTPAAENNAKQKQRQNVVRNDAARVAAKDVTGNFTLPEPDISSDMSALGALGSGGLSGGIGGSGGGNGDGSGPASGGPIGPGTGDGKGTLNPFGMVDPNAGALVGTFHDLKLSRTGRETGVDVKKAIEIIGDFTRRGWKSSGLNDYYQADQKLYQTKVYIPKMSADEAPAAFECGSEVKPSRWVVVYRGVVTPPATGKYRFVGAGDDILVVRFNGKHVFDHGFYSGTSPLEIRSRIPFLKGEAEDRGLEKNIRRDFPMPMPVTFYNYDTTKDWNRYIGGMAVGPEFEAAAGTPYPIEILISEIPGGQFGAALMIENTGTTYQKTSGGAPILPIFRLDGSNPAATKLDNAPPYDPKGPAWKLVPGKGKLDI